MSPPRWTARWQADVPLGDAWLSARERAVQAALRVARRRADWRLGRWTAKAAVGGVCGVGPERVEVLAAPDGAPEPFVDGRPVALSLSISHRAGHALAVVSATGRSAVISSSSSDAPRRSPRTG